MSRGTKEQARAWSLPPVLAGALGAMLALLLTVAHAQAALAQEGGSFDPESGAMEIAGVIGFLVLVIVLVFGAIKLFTGSVVPGLLILFMGGLFYAIAQDPTMIGDFGTWILSLFGMGEDGG